VLNRKAVLIFADPIGLDLARRRLPRFLRPLLSIRRFRASPIAADLHLFTSGKSSGLPGIQCHEQRGATFAERLEAATEKIASLGYDEIVLVGSDCPSLTADDIAAALVELTSRRLVLGPDHRGGCYLIALRAHDRQLLHGVRWNRGCDYVQLTSRVGAHEAAALPVKQDVDNWADVRLLARTGHYLALFVVVALARVTQWSHEFFVDLPAQAQRVRGQMPPPALAV
jgi:glycosyltransferase A (GT-A) superfamily protein (DUF2064 family)